MRIAQRSAAAVLVGASLVTGAAAAAVPAQAATPTHLAQAQADWVRGDRVAAAAESRYWRAARDELGHYGPRYRSQRQALATLVSLPITDTTAGQRATAVRLTRALNAFFDTPGRYGVSPLADPKAVARTQWVTSFRVASAERNRYLDGAIRALSYDVPHYGQQATQLAELAAIPLTDTTPVQRATATSLVRSLNDFFGTELG